MHITFGGVIFLISIIAVIIGIIVFKNWRAGKSISLKNLKLSFKKVSKDTVECMNVYPDRIVVENMLKKSVSGNVDTWQLGMRKVKLQMNTTGYVGLKLPDDISYPPGRLARMMGCLPIRQLKAMKANKWQQLVPYAVVIGALIISALLFIIVL